MGLPVVPLDSNNEKQHRTVIATATNELIKVRPPFDQTEGEAAAGAFPLNPQYPPGPSGGHIFRFIPSSEHSAILNGTSTYDASADIQRLINSLRPGDIVTIVGTVRAQGLLLKTSDIRFTGGGFIKPVSDVSATVLTIGDDSDNTLVRRISGHIRIGDITDNYTAWTNITGLKLVRCVEFVLDLDVTACAIGLDLAPSESAVAYNVFRLGLAYNNQIGIRFNPTGTAGFANENKFFGGRFSHGQALDGLGLVGIQFNQPGTFPPDNNVFYGPVFEHKGHSIEFNDGCTSNKILDCRMEPLITSGTEGVNWESELVTFSADSERNVFDMGMNTDPFTNANRNKDHGAGTRVTDYSFTIATDLTKWFFPGQVLRVTVGGVSSTVIVHESSYSNPNTTVRVYSPVITGNPTATKVPRITSLSTHGNTIRWDRHTDGTSDDICSLNERHAHKNLYRSSLYIHGLGSNHPALTLSHTTGADKALRVLDQNDTERMYVTANGDSKVRSLDINSLASISENGYAQVTRFGLGLTPIATQAANADTSGATLAALETEVNQLKATLRAFGLIAP